MNRNTLAAVVLSLIAFSMSACSSAPGEAISETEVVSANPGTVAVSASPGADACSLAQADKISSEDIAQIRVLKDELPSSKKDLATQLGFVADGVSANNPGLVESAKENLKVLCDESPTASEKFACEQRGFDSYASGVCYRWMDHNDPKFDCGYSSGRCSILEVSPDSGCTSLYVQANVLDDSGTIIGWANDMAKSVPANGNALIKLVTFEDHGKSFKLTELTCR